MNFPRASGILLHPTSLPNNFGIGDFGKTAYDFVDFLSETNQTYWQILPLNPTGYGDSPYQSFSAFAGNTMLISPEKLVEENLLTDKELKNKPDFPHDKVDYGAVYNWKNEILLKAFENFEKSGEFESFCDDVAWWLDDYALYRAIRQSEDHKPWFEWDETLRFRDEEAIDEKREKLTVEIEREKFYQFVFFRQWMNLKKYANENGVKIIGDLPIFVSADSADVWSDPSFFKLKESGAPSVVAGVPPDYFSKTGQLWGNPLYDWENLRADGFEWWKSRIGFGLITADVLRIDHFRGFEAVWEVPAEDKTAENGTWVKVPGWDLFHALRDGFPEMPFIAEDLGDITPEVLRLRDDFNLPGMKILQFAFGGGAENGYLPHNYPNNCAVYTGSHDNNTSRGWYKSANKHEREFCKKYLRSNGRAIHWDFINAAFSSVADTAIIQLQDVLGLDGKARMNFPSTTDGNWQWRFREKDLTVKIKEKLKEITETYGRNS
jgi:4-alpha-glucanotransferase